MTRSALRRMGLATAAGLVLAGGVLTVAGPQTDGAAPAAPRTGALGEAFADAARESGVPEPVLMAVAWNESRWDGHDGAPNADGGYGIMDLTGVPSAAPAGPRALGAAARLTGIPAVRLRTRDADNLRGGAALLAAAERRLTGRLPSDPAAWYDAVAGYGRAAGGRSSRGFADAVYALLASGAARTTPAGQTLRLPALPGLRPDRRRVPAPDPTAAADPPGAPCPSPVRCVTVPAARTAYQRADRPLDGLAVRYIVIHDTEGGYGSSVREFGSRGADAAAHYVMRSDGGAVTRMVRDEDVAFHAGNYWFNLHSVGIEHEGFAADGATWYTEAQYRATAALVRDLAARFGVPLDRQHVIGHDDVPGVSASTIAGMHWDPGPYWDWGHFMDLLGAGPARDGGPGGGMPATGTPVTIAPGFARDPQTVRVCGQPTGRGRRRGCHDQREASDILFVRTAPSASAPLYGDPALHRHGRPGTAVISDWGSTVSAGQRFVVAGRSGQWTAIWFGGAKVWFANPDGANTAPAPGSVLLTPSGGGAAPVYGVAYPERGEYPAGLTPSDGRPLAPYRVAPGQSYVATAGPAPADDYVPASGTVVTGRARYWTVQFGHRLGLLREADVSARS